MRQKGYGMKDTIPRQSIHNRKIILEVRYDSDPYIIDKRGKILKELSDTKVILDPKWQIGDGSIVIEDHDKASLSNRKCYVDSQRFSFSLSSGFTNESFYQNFDKLFEVVYKNLEVKILRIGCRIQGSYACQSNSNKQILDSFLKIFPDNFILNDFTPKDLRFHFMYENGQYQLGPTMENDIWLLQNFQNEETRNNSAGFAIDTDNYILRDASTEIKKNSIKDVFLASISVEKLLFDKLKSL